MDSVVRYTESFSLRCGIKGVMSILVLLCLFTNVDPLQLREGEKGVREKDKEKDDKGVCG